MRSISWVDALLTASSCVLAAADSAVPGMTTGWPTVVLRSSNTTVPQLCCGLSMWMLGYSKAGRSETCLAFVVRLYHAWHAVYSAWYELHSQLAGSCCDQADCITSHYACHVRVLFCLCFVGGHGHTTTQDHLTHRCLQERAWTVYRSCACKL